jgi:hypothetical protein
MYPAVEIWDLEDFKETKDDLRRVSRGGAHSRICVIMLINYLRKKV